METPDRFSLTTLEFGGVLALVREHLSGPISHWRLEELQPSTDLDRIRTDLARAGEARTHLAGNARPALSSLRDPRPLLEKLAVAGLACESLEILALTELARAAQDLRAAFSSSPLLDALASTLPDFQELLGELEGKILPDGSLDSSASPELARVRRAIERLRRETQAALQRLLDRFARAGILQESFVALRNDRLVIPIRAEERRRVEGVVHGASASGATLYLEPLETVPLNNELVEMEDRELAEIRRILGELTERLRERRQDLGASAEVLAEIDLVFAKAEFARAYDCCLPELAPGGVFALDQARHPLLERALRAQNRRPVPLTLRLEPAETVLVISGPNTGGKTLALKTAGITALMAQAGLPVAAARARLPLFGRVLADIGDLQSIAASLSTFSAHVTNIQRMAAAAGPGDLVLIDELGASTDPEEGAALAVAVLEHFRGRGTLALVTTHQSRLKAYAAETPGAANAAMEFDEETLEPTYRLLMGLPGKSSGLHVAERLGLAPSIVRRARELVAPEEREVSALLDALHRERAVLERKLQESEAERQALAARSRQLDEHYQAERWARLQELDRRLEEALRREGRRWEAALEELRAEVRAQAARGRPTKSRQRLEQKLERLPATIVREAREAWQSEVAEVAGVPAAPGEHEAALNGPPGVGDAVQVEGLPAPGTVIGLSGGEVEVEVGRLRLRIAPARVKVLARESRARARQSPPAGVPAKSRFGGIGNAVAAEVPHRPDVPPEINLIGHTAEEARERVDEYLDQAFVAGRFRLRIIHGHGKGILRRTLHEMFASHPHVEKFYPAPANEGGGGATIVELKR